MAKKILFGGESWTSFTTHVKGFDTFTTSVYEEGIEYIAKSIKKAGYELVYIPGHKVAEYFPKNVEEYYQYDCVVLSDIGANTLLLSDKTFKNGEISPNRCQSIVTYVKNGGSFLMIGGYLSFSGIDAKAHYGQTAINEILPVECLTTDDREEHPEGVYPKVERNHIAISNVPKNWPYFLGYNKVLPKKEFPVIVSINNDPLLVFGEFGKGKSAVFTSDCAPHWGPKEFLSWEGYDLLWKGILDYLIKG